MKLTYIITLCSMLLGPAPAFSDVELIEMIDESGVVEVVLSIEGLDDLLSPDRIEIVEYGLELWVRTIGETSGGFRAITSEVDRIAVALWDGDDVFYAPGIGIPMVVSGGRGDDHLTTGTANDKVAGDEGDDVILTYEGGDWITGGLGFDTIDSGDGEDTIYGYIPVEHYLSIVTCYQDADTIDGGTGSDYIEGGPDNDYIHGGVEPSPSSSIDVVYGYVPAPQDLEIACPDDDVIEVGGSLLQAHGGPGADRIYGGGYDDLLLGGMGNDRLWGFDGIDRLHGGGGDDDMYGHEGNDYFWGGAGNDALFGFDGSDTMRGGGGNDNLYGHLGDDYLDGGEGEDILRGGDHMDVLVGGVTDDDTDELYGGNDDDRLFGGGGFDLLAGDDGDDLLVCIDRAADDSLRGGTGFDSFWFDPGELPDDASAAESESNTHVVESIRNFEDYTWDGDEVPDPSPGPGRSYHDFTGHPLFGVDGPVAEDVRQRDIGSCWLLTGLAATAQVSQNAIRQAIIELPDGTFLVEWDGRHFRQDADLPGHWDPDPDDDPTTPGRWWPDFAGLGHSVENDDRGSLWVAILEKAVADSRFGAGEIFTFGEYDSVEIGTPAEAFRKLGGDGRSLLESLVAMEWIVSAETMANYIDAALASGEAVGCTTLALIGSEHLYARHAYMVRSVIRDASGSPYAVELYNPWGADIKEDDWRDGSMTAYDIWDDGILRVSIEEFYLAFRFSAVQVSISSFSRFDE